MAHAEVRKGTVGRLREFAAAGRGAVIELDEKRYLIRDAVAGHSEILLFVGREPSKDRRFTDSEYLRLLLSTKVLDGDDQSPFHESPRPQGVLNGCKLVVEEEVLVIEVPQSGPVILRPRRKGDRVRSGKQRCATLEHFENRRGSSVRRVVLDVDGNLTGMNIEIAGGEILLEPNSGQAYADSRMLAANFSGLPGDTLIRVAGRRTEIDQTDNWQNLLVIRALPADDGGE
ncbi:MAG: hypothetical protein R3313_00530 [Candidatus Saccharimonadales bacterium]|nr:hypothetical protein [Candidatus Saccharimonadales bacterium]